jgi:N,N'-diacetyllegionaminate synthase
LSLNKGGVIQITFMEIGPGFPKNQPPVLIIAEIGVNHNGDLNMALRLLDEAADCGADAVKIQAFDPDEMISKGTPKVSYQKEAGAANEDQYTLLQRLRMMPGQIEALMERAAQKKLRFLASVFDLKSAELLAKLGLKTFKIPSGELTNLPLVKAVAGYGKALIISTGMADLGEIEEAVTTAANAGGVSLALLHCVSSYPACYEDLNLRLIPVLQTAFQLQVGYSDHAPGFEAAIAAVALGAVIIEKHFTLERNLPGPDHKASLMPDEFRQLVESIRKTEMALGSGRKIVTETEQETRKLTRKSIVARTDIPKGGLITPSMLAVKRPGAGIAPKYIDRFVGHCATRNIPQGSFVHWNDLASSEPEEEGLPDAKDSGGFNGDQG